MTDKPTATSTPRGVDETSQWRVEGSAVRAGETGLDDTVVRMPRVPANGSSPTLAASPQPGPDYAPIPPSPVSQAPSPTARPAEAKKGIRRTRKARLRLSRLDPWSVMKTVFLFSIAFGIMLWVAVYMTWTMVESSGVFEAVNGVVTDLLASPNDTTPWMIQDYVSTNKVLGITALLAVVNVVLMTALGTLAAFLYNLSANILGGLEVTLAED